jgi:hypothetical protein
MPAITPKMPIKKVVKNKIVGQPHHGIMNSAEVPANRIDGSKKIVNDKINLHKMFCFIELPSLFHRKSCLLPVSHTGTVYTNQIF